MNLTILSESPLRFLYRFRKFSNGIFHKILGKITFIITRGLIDS
jgi:hypothetical protein